MNSAALTSGSNSSTVVSVDNDRYVTPLEEIDTVDLAFIGALRQEAHIILVPESLNTFILECRVFELFSEISDRQKSFRFRL
jgi:hypothetical protein